MEAPPAEEPQGHCVWIKMEPDPDPDDRPVASQTISDDDSTSPAQIQSDFTHEVYVKTEIEEQSDVEDYDGGGSTYRGMPHEEVDVEVDVMPDDLPPRHRPKKRSPGKKLVCLHCNETFNTQLILEKHFKSHTKDWQSLTCPLCQNQFSTVAECRIHIKTHSKKVKCLLCDRMFARNSCLKRHLPSHSDLRDHSCDLCDKRFTSITNLNQHKQSHNVRLVTCAHCSEDFDGRRNLSHHIKQVHDVIGKIDCFPCDQCNLECLDLHTLRAHIKLAHVGALKHRCKVCDECFTSMETLGTHAKQHLRNQVKCDYCAARFKTVKRMQRHAMKMHSETVFRCAVCLKSYTCERYLKLHQRIHVKPEQCDVCKMQFSYKIQLARHMLSHTGEDSAVKYSCLVCSKSFQGIEILKIHHRVHSKPFRCDNCERGFSSKHLLGLHQEVHAADKRYECSVCGKAFGTMFAFTRHKSRHSRRKNLA